MYLGSFTTDLQRGLFTLFPGLVPPPMSDVQSGSYGTLTPDNLLTTPVKLNVPQFLPFPTTQPGPSPVSPPQITYAPAQPNWPVLTLGAIVLYMLASKRR